MLPEDGAAGIRQGSEVYFLGTLVGSVTDVEVDAKGGMEAQANIRRDFFRFVRADSSAVVKKKFGVAGDSFFEITRGQGEPLPENNAAIVCKEQFQSALETAVEEVRAEAMQVLKKTSLGLDTWTKLGADLHETQQHLEQVSVRLENMIAWHGGRQKGHRRQVDNRIPLLADEAQKLLARAKRNEAELQGAVTNLNIAAKNVRNGIEARLAGNHRLRGKRSERSAGPGPANQKLDDRTRAIGRSAAAAMVDSQIRKQNQPGAAPPFV